MTVFVEPIKPKSGQIPLHYHISISATLNNRPVETKKISYKPGDKLELGFELLELEYDPESHQRKEKEYRKMHSFSPNFGGRFVSDLKTKLQINSKEE